MVSGMMISVEGNEGCGKTTVIRMLEEYLMSKGCDVLLTREPGGVRIAEQIRDVILDLSNTEMDPKTEAILYAAGRNESVKGRVLPALKEGKIVLCDRFIDSSLVYQGYARGIGINEVFELNKFAIGDYLPDLTIYLDVDPRVGLDRIAMNKEREINRLDKESLEFHYKVREGYLEVLKAFPGRIKKVNANKSPEDVLRQIKVLLRKELNI